MNLKTFILFAVLIFPDICFGDNIREIHVKTADCDGCGMTFLGQLSIKVLTISISSFICEGYPRFSIKMGCIKHTELLYD